MTAPTGRKEKVMGDTRRCLGLLLSAAVLAVPLSAQSRQESIANWPAPPFWSPGEAAATSGDTREDQRPGPPAIHAESALSVPTSPLPFIGITPCRIANTTAAGGFTGAYGPPALSQGVPRDFTLAGQCGIPGTAQAVSLNLTVVNTKGPGFIRIFPTGGVNPTVSTLNYVAGQVIANAAVVALGTGGAVTVVAGVSDTDLIIDTNGYYAGAAVGVQNTYLGNGAGASTTTGVSNTAIGDSALASTTTGGANTAIGVQALFANTTGDDNTAIGLQTLASNTTGINNTAIGVQALFTNTTGNLNTVIGDSALFSNTIGIDNTGSGAGALLNNTTGDNNTAVGFAALLDNTTGSGNIALGVNAGVDLTTGNNNICIGASGVAGESQTTRVGQAGSQVRAFIAGVRGVTTGNADAVPVMIDSAGQLGTVSSSARFKEEVEDMAEASSRLLKLRPVTFRYKGQAGARTQFGLIAEEVEKVLPELVVSDSAGEAETVLYHEMPAMLLNELQKQEARIAQQTAEIEQLKAELAALRTAVAQH
jgi:endosialidase-like protein